MRRNYESACLVRHHRCIYFYFVIFLIFAMEILRKCSPAKNFWCSSLGGHSSLTFVMRWLLWRSFTVTKDGCRQLFVEHYPLGYVWGPQLIHLCLCLHGAQLQKLGIQRPEIRVFSHLMSLSFNSLTPKIWLLILPSSCYTIPCKLVMRTWC